MIFGIGKIKREFFLRVCRRIFPAIYVFLAVFVFLIPEGYGDNGLPLINNVIAQQHMAGKKRILIPPGRYGIIGSVLIDDAFSKKEIVADGEVVIISSLDGPVFNLAGTEHVTIKGFTLKSVNPVDPSQPIAFSIQSQTSDNNRTVAIRITDSSNIKILENIITGYWTGIFITTVKYPSHDIVVKDNRVTDCGYWSIASHHKLKRVNQYCKLSRIFFLNNYTARCEQGPVFRGVRDGIIEGNEVTDNIIGVRLEQSSKNIVRGNIIHRNLESGILLYNGSFRNRVTGNQIYDNNMQATRIRRIAKKYGMDPNYLPGDLVCYERTSKNDHVVYQERISGKEDILDLNEDFWPYPTAYEHITPGLRFGPADRDERIKYWGMYFCQKGGVGIELRNRASKNIIKENEIYNSSPLKMDTGFMVYGIRISQLGLVDTEEYASRNNVILNNRIRNMVKGSVLDDNIVCAINADNIY